MKKQNEKKPELIEKTEFMNRFTDCDFDWLYELTNGAGWDLGAWKCSKDAQFDRYNGSDYCSSGPYSRGNVYLAGLTAILNNFIEVGLKKTYDVGRYDVEYIDPEFLEDVTGLIEVHLDVLEDMMIDALKINDVEEVLRLREQIGIGRVLYKKWTYDGSNAKAFCSRINTLRRMYGCLSATVDPMDDYADATK